jgi:hypothetical protein
LVLQGGGSFGAFGCGVFKSLAKNDIKLCGISTKFALEGLSESMSYELEPLGISLLLFT